MKKVFILFVYVAFLFSGCAKETGDSASVTTEVPEVGETGVSFQMLSKSEVVGKVYNVNTCYVCSGYLYYDDQIYAATQTYTVTDLEESFRVAICYDEGYMGK